MKIIQKYTISVVLGRDQSKERLEVQLGNVGRRLQHVGYHVVIVLLPHVQLLLIQQLDKLLLVQYHLLVVLGNHLA